MRGEISAEKDLARRRRRRDPRAPSRAQNRAVAAGEKLRAAHATSLARLYRDQGSRLRGRDFLAPVYSWFTKGFDTPDLIAAKALLADLNGKSTAIADV